jgi:hypothetical protein
MTADADLSPGSNDVHIRGREFRELLFIIGYDSAKLTASVRGIVGRR